MIIDSPIISGSLLVTGSVTVTGSLAVSQGIIAASFTGSLSGSSVTASLFGTASWSTNSVNALATASVSNNTLTFTKGNGTQFSLSVSTGSTQIFATNGSGSIYSLTPASYVPTVTASILIGQSAGDNNAYAIHIGTESGTNADHSDTVVTIGYQAGKNSSNIGNSVVIGVGAGFVSPNASDSIFIGNNAGNAAGNLSNAVAIGTKASTGATSASGSIIIGFQAGLSSTNSANSIGIGLNSFYNQTNAPYNIALGYYAGYAVSNADAISRNNIIIGNAVTLPKTYTDYANIGGVLFISGTYFGSTNESSPVMSSGSKSTARVGIGILNPQYTLDVSGSGRFSNGLTVTGSLIATSLTGSLSGSSVTASLFGTASWAVSASQALTASRTPNAVVTASLSGSNTIRFEKGDASFFAVTVGAGSSTFPYSGSAVITGSLLVSGSQTITGSLNAKGTTTLSGSLKVTGSVSLNGLNSANTGYNLQYDISSGDISYLANTTITAASTDQINTPDANNVFVRPQELETSKHATINIFNYLNFS